MFSGGIEMEYWPEMVWIYSPCNVLWINSFQLAQVKKTDGT